MTLRVRSKKNLAAGVMFIAISVVFLVIGSEYEMGSITRMATGYFPAILASLLLVIGIIVVATSLFIEGEKISGISFRPMAFVLGGLVLFAGAMESLGLMLSTTILVFVSSLAMSQFRVREIMGSVLFLMIFSYVVFSYGLEIPFRLWPWEL